MSRLLIVGFVSAALSLTALSGAARAQEPAARVAKTYSIDTPIVELVADPAAKAVLDALVPELTTHPQYESFKAMSLERLAPLSQGRLTDDLLAKLQDALSRLSAT